MTSDMPAFLKRLAPMVLFGARLAALTFWTTAAVAQQNGLQTLNTGDEARGWEAVGRVDITGKGFCTGTLIETDLVLTAAHCLYAPDGTAQVQSNDIQFRAGLRNGRPETERGARGFMVHPDYDPTDPDKTSRLRYDVALIVLDRPIGAAQIAPFDVSTNGLNGRDIGVVSYGQGAKKRPLSKIYVKSKPPKTGS